MSKGKHRDDGSDKSKRQPGKHRVGNTNTSDPKTCAHQGHLKARAQERGGFDRYCMSCKLSWWTNS